MTDPATLTAIITGLVSTLSAYMTYKVGMKQAEQKGVPEPDTPAEETAKQGEQIHAIVKAGVEDHGDEDEKVDLTNFERNPQRYRDSLMRVLIDIAARTPNFQEQIQSLDQQFGKRSTGDQYMQNVIGNNNAVSGSGPATVNISSPKE